MKTIIYTLLAFVLLLSGCKTTKQATKTDTAIKESVMLDISAETTETKQDEARETVAHQEAITENVSETTTVIKLSEPNADGIQHISEIVVKERNKQTAKAATTTAETEQKTVSEKEATITDRSTSDTDTASTTSETTKEKIKLPAWWYVILISGCILFGFSVRRLAKSKSIKPPFGGGWRG
ncbi:hypothetical protein D0T49_00395 [Paludibacter sp. 221]|uniref:hypothetical protein n=1 Tax=Paludibacter sp. 221 TaxID=2302939 RepID=UPI0013D0C398|nr:hypothetical protein [Paludibacter sp. 221]NDV45512.1 hypothetical protein [Paludibacter sp. 221]